MPNCKILTETELDNFVYVLKFLVENELLESAVTFLKKQGHSEIRVSIEVVEDIQKFISEEFLDKGHESEQAEVIVSCSHNHC